LKKNLRLYLFSFGFALILWLYLKFNVVYNVELQIPLNLEVSNTQALSENIPDSVRVVASGKGWDLLNLVLSREDDFSINVSDVRNDTRLNLRQLLAERFTVPSNVSILSVEPESININFEKVSSKYVKVISRVKLNLAEGYEIVGEPIITPDSVLVTGASSVISKIKNLSTESKTIDDVNESITQTISLKDTLSNIIRVEPTIVTVSFTVDLLSDEVINDVTVGVEGAPDDKEVLLVPPRINITLRGGVNDLAGIDAADLRVLVRYADIEKDSLGFVIPEIVLPIDASIIKIEPETLQYIIKSK
jgi:YbbR domain-containing protein